MENKPFVKYNIYIHKLSNNQMNKRGLSEIVTGVIIIILAIVAVAIIWSFIKPTLEKTGSEIELVSEISSPIKIKSVQEDTDKLNILLERNKNTNNLELEGTIFTIEDSTGKTYSQEDIGAQFANLDEFETIAVQIDFTKSTSPTIYTFFSGTTTTTLSDIKKVSARAKIKLTSGNRLSRTSSSFVIGGSGGGSSSGSGGSPTCTPINYYQDRDLDTFGDATQIQSSCTQPSGYVTNDDDCNDGSDLVNPTAKEICEISESIIVTDDDCDGDIDLQDDNCWGQNGEWCDNADLNRDLKVEIGDLTLIADLWGRDPCNKENSWCSGGDIKRDGGPVAIGDFTAVNEKYNAVCTAPV